MFCPAVVQGFLAIQFDLNPMLEVKDSHAIISFEFWNVKYQILLSRSANCKGKCYDIMHVSTFADIGEVINGTTKILEKFIKYGMGNK